MEIKALNIKQNDCLDEEDFFLSCEGFIGPKDEVYVYEVYDFNIISIKRLYDDYETYRRRKNRAVLQRKFRSAMN